MEHLKLENQICFPFYAISRLITRAYQPFLDSLNITYPQYLVLLVLWENDNVTVNEIANKLILNTNTVTPLLKRMEIDGIISRNRSEKDERKVIVSLTQKGKDMKIEATRIPENLLKSLKTEDLDLNNSKEFKAGLDSLMSHLSQIEQ
jgi:DNA-binding MarR family transcriptional regulator